MRYNSLLDNTEIVSGKIDVKKFLEGKRSISRTTITKEWNTALVLL